MLNFDLAGGLRFIQYLQHSYSFVRFYRGHIHSVLKEISKDEMKHTEEFAKLI